MPDPVVSVLFVAFGLPAAVYARRIARFNEQLDAIGSTRSGTVEPAGWHVALTRISGVVLVSAGVAGLLGVL